MPDLLGQYRHREDRHDTFVVDLLRRLILQPPPTGAATTGYLTDRELTVLRFLRPCSRSREIADDLFVSVNTVKAHMRSLYRRLGVDTRRAAIERARTLGLL